MASDVLITPSSGLIQFSSSAGSGSGQIKVDGDDLVISNVLGDVLLGDGASDVFIGDGTNNVDIVFEQNGEIRDDASGKSITLGSKTTNILISGSNTIALQKGGGNVGIGKTAATTTLEVEGDISGSGTGSFSHIIGTTIELPNDSIPIAQLASDAVTVTAGTGLTGGGSVTLGGSTTVNVIGGDGITANANDMAITAAQTTIESIYKADLVIGEDAQTKIDFETANEIHFDVNNVELVNMNGSIVSGSGASTASFGHFIGNGSGLTGVSATLPGGVVSGSAQINSLINDTIAATIVGEIDNDEIPIAKLASDAITIAGTSTALGGSITADTIAGQISADTISGNQINGGTIGSVTISALAGALSLGDNNITNVGDINCDSISIDAAGTGLDIVFGGNTTKNKITLTDNLADALNITEGSNSYIKFTTTDNGEEILISENARFTNAITASGDISSSGTITAATLDAAAVSDGLAAAIVAEIDNDEIPIAKLAEDAVTYTAGTGMTGGGAVTLGGSATINVIGGDGITANANDMAITAAQTTITSIYNTSLKIGRDSSDLIDFASSDNTIRFRVSGSDEMNLVSDSLKPHSNNGLALGASNRQWSDLFLAEGGVINFDNGDVTITQTGNVLAVAGTTDTTFVGNISASGDLDVKHRLFDTGSTQLGAVGGGIGDVINIGDTATVPGAIYQLQGGGTWALTDADAAASATGSIAVALGANSTTNGMLLRGLSKLNHDPGGLVGAPLYLAVAAGSSSNAVPSGNNDIARIVGHNIDASGMIYFNPDNTFVEVTA